ncbi:MAG TPA: biopolymer transporter ExbD [Chitinophagales bacterium]|nr:biopolymer transporter ExbD [Chitinophagales bacterium]
MAELGESGDVHSGRGKKRGGVRAKKLSTRIDMTPMVDLGFLLVTFFILTTTMQKPKAMQVGMPDKKDTTKKENKIRASEAMSLILGAEDKIYYYFGEDSASKGGPQMLVANYKDIRKILIDRNQFVLDLQHQNGWKNPKGEYMGVYVLIKPTNDSKYKNTVDILDEMKITQIKSYAILDVTQEELAEIPK